MYLYFVFINGTENGIKNDELILTKNRLHLLSFFFCEATQGVSLSVTLTKMSWQYQDIKQK